MSELEHFCDAVVLTDKLRSDFKAVADLHGAHRAFEVFAVAMSRPYQEQARFDTEERMVRLVRALYDDYVGATGNTADAEAGR